MKIKESEEKLGRKRVEEIGRRGIEGGMQESGGKIGEKVKSEACRRTHGETIKIRKAVKRCRGKNGKWKKWGKRGNAREK